MVRINPPPKKYAIKVKEWFSEYVLSNVGRGDADEGEEGLLMKQKEIDQKRKELDAQMHKNFSSEKCATKEIQRKTIENLQLIQELNSLRDENYKLKNQNEALKEQRTDLITEIRECSPISTMRTDKKDKKRTTLTKTMTKSKSELLDFKKEAK